MNEKYILEVSKELNVYLSDLHVLYTKLHNFHWNVVGEGFFTLHSKLEEIYEGVANEIDEIAERILMVGGRPLASLKDYMGHATLVELDSVDIHGRELLELLLADFEAMLKRTECIHTIAAEADDSLTASLLENSIGHYQKNLWMMKAYLK